MFRIDDAVVRVWDLAGDTDWPDGVRLLDPGARGSVTDLAFLPGGALLSASAVGLRLWNVEAGTFEWLLERESEYRVLGVDESGQILATVGSDFETFKSDSIQVWDRTQDLSWEVTSHGDRLFSLDVSPDGLRLISGDWDGVVRVGPVTGRSVAGRRVADLVVGGTALLPGVRTTSAGTTGGRVT